MEALDRDTLFRKLRSKPENKVAVISAGLRAACLGHAAVSSGQQGCACSGAVPRASQPTTCVLAACCAPCAPGLLRLPREEPNVGVGAVRRVHLPGLRGHPQKPGRACQLREVCRVLCCCLLRWHACTRGCRCPVSGRVTVGAAARAVCPSLRRAGPRRWTHGRRSSCRCGLCVERGAGDTAARRARQPCTLRVVLCDAMHTRTVVRLASCS
jgi:hypothetical protein